MFSIELNNTRYYEGSKCPACSSEVDKGGRLHFKQKKNWYLKCERCKYLIETERVRNKRENYLESRRKKRVLVKEGFGRRKKNLKITKKMAKEIQRQRMMLKRRKELEAIAERDTEEMNERYMTHINNLTKKEFKKLCERIADKLSTEGSQKEQEIE